MIFAGTSFSVGVTDLVLHFGIARNLPIFNIDPQPVIKDPHVTNIAAGSEVALVEVCKELGIAL